MSEATASFLLAIAIEPGVYVSPLKIAVVVVLTLGWGAVMQWVDRDTDVVKTRREQWNLIVLSGGAVAAIVLFLVPWPRGLFVVGVLFWIMLAGGAVMAYIMHRNGRTAPAARVLTLNHLKRLAGREEAGKVKDKGQRVQIVDHKGDMIGFPDEPEDAKDFAAVQDFLYDILSRRAADVDLVAGKEKYRLVHRIDGVAIEHAEGVGIDEGARIIRFLKKAGGLNVEEMRRPQAGRIQAALLSHDGDVGKSEVQTSGTTAGERLHLRMQANPTLLRLHELGMATPRLESVRKILGKNHGLLLLSAPPQHGLTTTQYAILKSHDAYMNNIHALERRPLIDVDNITQQRYEGANTDVNYARMLQTVLRREPDIVLVGECEDRETALIGTRAAAENRKIYMGMHASDSFDALGRYLSLVDDPNLAPKALLGVTNQRLVRVLCTECREAFQPDPQTIKKLNLPADKIERFYRPPTERKKNRKGQDVLCPACQNTGYVGRIGVFEVLDVDEEISKLIADGAPINRIKAQCRKNRMYYLQEEGLLKVIDGTTSMNEILRCLRANGKP